jgi:hypothetical protein
MRVNYPEEQRCKHTRAEHGATAARGASVRAPIGEALHNGNAEAALIA